MAAKILNNLDGIAVVSGGLFTGAVLYMSAIESPALRELGYDVFSQYFPHMFKKATPLPLLALTAGVTGVLHGLRNVGPSFYRYLWIGSGSIFLSVIPYTILFLGPVNKILSQKEQTSEVSANQRKGLIDKWISLHMVRTIGAIIGFSEMVYGLSHRSSLALNL